jgi:hypothetical protein
LTVRIWARKTGHFSGFIFEGFPFWEFAFKTTPKTGKVTGINSSTKPASSLSSDSSARSRVSAEKRVADLEEELKGIDVNATSIRKERVSEYGNILRRNFAALDVNTYSQTVFQTLNPSLVETGSTLPRALLGYQFRNTLADI